MCVSVLSRVCVCLCLCVRVPRVLVKYSKIDLTPKAFSRSQTGREREREKDLFSALLSLPLLMSLLFSSPPHFVSPNFLVHPSPSPSLSLGLHPLFPPCSPFSRLVPSPTISAPVYLFPHSPNSPCPCFLHYIHLFHIAGIHAALFPTQS